MGRWLWVALIVAVGGVRCASAPIKPADLQALARADALVLDGCYDCLLEARGIYGQAIYIDPKAEMVIVRHASHPYAANAANDPVTLPAFAAVAKELMK